MKKGTDGKEKESCCIIKLFIFLHGMVNKTERRLDAVWPRRRLPTETTPTSLPQNDLHVASSTLVQQIENIQHTVTSIYNGRPAAAPGKTLRHRQRKSPSIHRKQEAEERKQPV